MFIGKKLEVQLFGGTITHAEGSLGLPLLTRSLYKNEEIL